MAPPFGVSWLCVVLWSCICYPAHKGYNIVHGYPVGDDKTSSYGGVLAPSTSERLGSGAPSNTGHDPSNQTQSVEPQSFISTLTELGPHASETQFGALTPTPSPTEPREREDGVKGVSFPTIPDLIGFIETMKRSYLKPRSDVKVYFQTARDVLEKELSSARKTDSESQIDFQRNSEANDWNEPVSTVSEENQDASYYKPDGSLSLSNPATSTQSPMFDYGDSVFYPSLDSAAGDHVSSNYGSSSTASGEPESSASNFEDEGEDIQSVNDILSGYETSVSQLSSGQDLYFHDPVPAPLVNSQISQQLDEMANFVSGLNTQEPKYESHSISDGNSFVGYRWPSSSFDNAITQVSQTDVPSVQMPSSFKISREKLFIPLPLTEQEGKSAQPWMFQVPIGKESWDLSTPTDVQLPVSSGFALRSSKPSPKYSGGHVTFQAVSSPTSSAEEPKQNLLTYVSQPKVLNQNVVANKPRSSKTSSANVFGSDGHRSVSIGLQILKETEMEPGTGRSHLSFPFTVKPTSSFLGNARQDYQIDHVVGSPTYLPIPSTQSSGQNSDHTVQIQVPDTQAKKHVGSERNTQSSVLNGYDYHLSGISPRGSSDGYVASNSPFELAQNLEPREAFTATVNAEESIKEEQNDFDLGPNDSDGGSYHPHPNSRGTGSENFAANTFPNMLPRTSQDGETPGVRKTTSLAMQHRDGRFRYTGDYMHASSADPIDSFDQLLQAKSREKMAAMKQNYLAQIRKELGSMTSTPTIEMPLSKSFAWRPFHQRGSGYETSRGLPPPPSYVMQYRKGYIRAKESSSQSRYSLPHPSTGGATYTHGNLQRVDVTAKTTDPIVSRIHKGGQADN